MSDAKPFGLMNFRQDNWSDRAPVAILNEASTLHERIVYCWSIVRNAQTIAELLSESDCSDDAKVAEVFRVELEPVCALLEKMAQDSWSLGGSDSSSLPPSDASQHSGRAAA